MVITYIYLKSATSYMFMERPRQKVLSCILTIKVSNIMLKNLVALKGLQIKNQFMYFILMVNHKCTLPKEIFLKVLQKVRYQSCLVQ